jgi:hypothetical protein
MSSNIVQFPFSVLGLQCQLSPEKYRTALESEIDDILQIQKSWGGVMFLMEPIPKFKQRALRTITLGYNPDEPPAKLIKALHKNTTSYENWWLYDFGDGSPPSTDCAE